MSLPTINTTDIDTKQDVEISVFGMVTIKDNDGPCGVLASSQIPEREAEHFDVIVQPQEDEGDGRDPILEFENLTNQQANEMFNKLTELFPNHHENIV